MNQNKTLLEDKTLEEVRQIGFPIWDYTDNELKEKFQELCNYDENCVLENDVIKTRKSFTKIASIFFPHMFSTRVFGMKSPMEAWNNDKLLQRAINIAKKYQKNATFATLRSKLMIVSGTQMVSNFRPEVAKLIYNKFGNNGKIYDFSIGYGGRLTGFLASNCNEYVGVDVNSLNFDGYNKLNNLYNITNKTIKLHKVGSEFFNSDNNFDLAFSSPPYYTKEIYSDDMEQSCNKYKTYDEWLNLYWRKTCDNCFSMLKIGGYFIVNIANISLGGKLYLLSQDALKIILESGFELENTWYYSLKKTIGTRNSFNDKDFDYKKEPIFICRKPI